MAYVVITSTLNSIVADFGVYAGVSTATGIIPKKRILNKIELVFSLIGTSEESTYVEAQTIYNGLTFPISFNGVPGTFKVDSVNGIAPVSNDNLCELLQTMLN